MNSFWKIIIILFLIGILMSGIVYHMTKPSHPIVVNIYKWRYEQMSDQKNKDLLVAYTRSVMKDPIEGLNYSELLEWEHKWLRYTEGYLKQPRPELPIPIIERGLGRCGEFALLYTGLCLANNIEVRLVIDCSVKTDNRSTADHVWNEVYVDGKWIHVDPTENKIDQPDLYAVKWNKNVNRVYAITVDEIIDVTDTYKGVA